MDRFERKHLSIAVAGIFGGFIGTAAVAQNQLPVSAATLSGATVVYLSGASAQDVGLRNVIRRLCVPGTLDQFVAGTDRFAYVCQPNASQSNGAIAGNLVIHKTSVGGSGNGVQPVADATALAFFNLNTMFANIAAFCGTASTVNAVAPVAPDTLGLPAFQTRTCNLNAVENKAPDAGLSDVEPNLLFATAAQVSALNSRGANQVVFGIAVSKTMYNGLQTAQGLGSDDSLANMPSLTKMQIANIFTGRIANTRTLLADKDGANTLLPLKPIIVAQRVSTSGSQAITEAFFLNQRCAAGAPNFAAADYTVDNSNNAFQACKGTAFVDPDPFNDPDNPAPSFDGSNAYRIAGSSGGQVVSCLRGADTASAWAIGMQTTETNAQGATSNGLWRYIKVDGFAPTLLDAAQGQYPFVAEQSMQWRTTLTEANFPSAFRTVNYIRSQLGNPVVIRALNTSFVQHYGQAGLLGVPNGSTIAPSGVPVNEAQIVAQPVNTWSKSAGLSLNNCAVPAIINRQAVLPN